MNKPNELEKRAVAAMSDEGLRSETAAALIAELVSAIAAARAEAHAAEERALDPQQSPDLKAARERRDDAQLKVGRLETLLAQVQRSLTVVRELEWVKDYTAKRDELQIESDAIEAELRETYADCAQRIYEVFGRAVEFKERAARMLGALPPQTAPLRQYDPRVERLLQTVKLYDFKGEQAWPLPSAQLGVSYAENAANFPAHIRGSSFYIGPGWETMQEEFQRTGEAERARQATHYQEMTEQQEVRQNAEERANFFNGRGGH